MKQTTLSIAVLFLVATSVLAQSTREASRRTPGTQTIYGDITVHESSGAENSRPLSLDLLLYTEAGNLQSRQTVSSKGRYRFINLNAGRYYIVIELESREIARLNVDLSSTLLTDIRQDIEFQWQPSGATKAAVLSAADQFDRPARTAAIFKKASSAIKDKHYDQAVDLLHQVVEIDPADFPAWAELGRAYFLQKNYVEAENAYLQAISKQPKYGTGLISLGRLRIVQKNFDGAIEALTQAVKVEPTSPEANYFLGEAYLQNKKGSLAVGYLNEAIKLDPVGMADAHLRLATLYNAVGMKDKAANEYEQFLKKVPDYPDKKKLEEYVTANKKP